jgi:hypothetical protein
MDFSGFTRIIDIVVSNPLFPYILIGLIIYFKLFRRGK